MYTYFQTAGDLIAPECLISNDFLKMLNEKNLAR